MNHANPYLIGPIGPRLLEAEHRDDNAYWANRRKLREAESRDNNKDVSREDMEEFNEKWKQKYEKNNGPYNSGEDVSPEQAAAFEVSWKPNYAWVIFTQDLFWNLERNLETIQTKIANTQDETLAPMMREANEANSKLELRRDEILSQHEDYKFGPADQFFFENWMMRTFGFQILDIIEKSIEVCRLLPTRKEECKVKVHRIYKYICDELPRGVELTKDKRMFKKKNVIAEKQWNTQWWQYYAKWRTEWNPGPIYDKRIYEKMDD